MGWETDENTKTREGERNNKVRTGWVIETMISSDGGMRRNGGRSGRGDHSPSPI